MFTDAQNTSNWIRPDDLYRWAADLRAMCHTYVRQCTQGSDKIRLLKVPIRFNTLGGYALLTGYDPLADKFCISVFNLDGDSERVISTNATKILVNDIPLDTIMLFVEKVKAHQEDVHSDAMNYLFLPKDIQVADRVVVLDKRQDGFASYHACVVDVVGYAVKVQVSLENSGRTDIGMIYSTTVAYLAVPEIL